MSQTPPFDQDDNQPRRGGSTRRAESRPTSRSSGGRAARRSASDPGGSQGSRGSGGPRRSEGSSGASATGGSGLPRWVVPAGAAFAAVIVLLIVLRSCTGGTTRTDAGACLTELADHLPATATAVQGTDFVQAARAGWPTDGSLEEIGAALEETGVMPDPVTSQFRINRLATLEQFEARTGMSPGDVECTLSAGATSVLSGSFDPPAVSGSQAGSQGTLAASEDLLAMATGRAQPKALLEPAEDSLGDDEAFVEAVEALRDAGAYSVIVQRGDGEDGRPLAAGIGAGGSGEDRTVQIAWVFDSDDDAKAGRPEIVNRVNDVLEGTLSISAAELEVDGSLVHATVASRAAPPLQDVWLRAVRLVDLPE